MTVSLPEAKDIVVKCEPEGLFKFSATGPQEEKYEFTLDLYGAIAPEVCSLYFSFCCSIRFDNCKEATAALYSKLIFYKCSCDVL